jgi:xylan 1,4-beta-xylosidase
MKKWFLALAASILCAHAQSQDPTYSNPVMAGDFPDPSVLRVGKDYWATATSSEWSPQFPILHSRDLVNWEVVGSVFPNRPAWATGNFWAPEITKYNGLYYVYYVGRKKDGPLSVAVAIADQPQGPYKDYGPMVSQPDGSIDPFFCKDEHGDPYLIWKEDGNSKRRPCILWAQKLDKYGVRLIGEPKELLRNDTSWEGAVIEGASIVQRGDYFYLFYSGSGCCGVNCNYALGVARSKSLLGPWEKNPGNPILAGNGDWRCPGHGTIVSDGLGRFWLLYHSYNAKSFVFTGREALLDEVRFTADGWAEFNQGSGPSVEKASPFGVRQFKNELRFSDDFNKSALGAGWNWPVADHNPSGISNGKLVISARLEQGTNLMGAVIGRSITSGDFVADTILVRGHLEPETIAGLAALGDRANSTGVALVDDRVILWNRHNSQQTILAEADAPRGRRIHFRLKATGGKDYEFAFSGDGKKWTDLAPASGQHLPPWDRAVRVGLTVGGARGAEARFDSFDLMAVGSVTPQSR